MRLIICIFLILFCTCCSSTSSIIKEKPTEKPKINKLTENQIKSKIKEKRSKIEESLKLVNRYHLVFVTFEGNLYDIATNIDELSEALSKLQSNDRIDVVTKAHKLISVIPNASFDDVYSIIMKLINKFVEENGESISINQNANTEDVNIKKSNNIKKLEEDDNDLDIEEHFP